MEKTFKQKLLAVQSEIKAVKKTQDNPYFKSKYADINAMLSEIKPILGKNGLILIQGLSVHNDKNSLTTKIFDADGEGELSAEVLLPEIQDPQKFGSAVTYYRRYSIQSLLSLETEDDDGNYASDNMPTVQYPEPKKPVKSWKPATDVFAHVKAQLKDLGYDPRTLKEADELVIKLTGLKLQAVNVDEIEGRLSVKIAEKEPNI